MMDDHSLSDLPSMAECSRIDLSPVPKAVKALISEGQYTQWGSSDVAAKRSSEDEDDDEEDSADFLGMVRMGMDADEDEDENEESFEIIRPSKRLRTESSLSISRVVPPPASSRVRVEEGHQAPAPGMYLSSMSRTSAVPKGITGDEAEKKVAQLTKENEILQKQLKATTKQRQPTTVRLLPSPDVSSGSSVRVKERQVRAEAKHGLAERHRAEVDALEAQIRALRQENLRRESAHSIHVEILKKTIANLELAVESANARADEADKRATQVEDALRMGYSLEHAADAAMGTLERALNTSGDAQAILRGVSVDQVVLDSQNTEKRGRPVQATEAPRAHVHYQSDHTKPLLGLSPVGSVHSSAGIMTAGAKALSFLIEEECEQTRANHPRHAPLLKESDLVSLLPDDNGVPSHIPGTSSGTDTQSREGRTVRDLPCGAVEVTGPLGQKTVTFRNGTVKELTTDGRIMVRFVNGDVKEECEDGTCTYFFKETKTTEIRYPNGLVLTHFADNQMEKSHTDGTREVIFPDGTRARFSAKGILMK